MSTGSHRLVQTFQSTCMVHNYDGTIEVLGRIVGLRVLEYSEQVSIGRRGGMTWIGDNSLEVAQPIPRVTPPTASWPEEVLACIRMLSRSATWRPRLICSRPPA